MSVCALPDGRLLTGSEDKFARVFSDTGAELLKMQHGGSVQSVCALPDGRLLTGSDDNFARVFSDTGAELFKMQHGDWVWSVCALPDGRLLTGSRDNFARVFSDTGVELFKMQHGGWVYVRLRPSGWAPAHGFQGQVCARVLGHRSRTFEDAARRSVLSVCALPDGRLLTGSFVTDFARVFSDTTFRGR